MKKQILSSMYIFLPILYIINYGLGNIYNVNNILMFIYIISTILTFIYDKQFFIKYIYLYISITLYVVGVYFCNFNGAYLYEISQYTKYNNSLSLALFANSLMLACCYLFSSIKKHESLKMDDYTNQNESCVLYYLSYIIIVLELVTLIQLFAKGSSRSLGLDRVVYSREILSGFTLKMKNNLILALPIFYLSKGKHKNKLLSIYVLLYVIILFMTGEKYGPYIRLFYFLIILYPQIFQYVKKRIYVVFFVFIMALGIVYIQYSSLYGYTKFEFYNYLQNRLCQQGQVWWAIYGNIKYSINNINEFVYEMKACIFNSIVTQYPYAGQWKMMYLAANGSALFLGRIKNMIPFTMTTMASTYYYFGIIGLIIVYVFFGYFYYLLIGKIIPMIKESNVIVGVLSIKVFIMFEYLMTASNMTEIFSLKGLVFILLLIICKNFSKKYKIRGL